jgi:hypothetical protein
MESTVNQRLIIIVDTFEKGKKAGFARATGLSTTGVQEMLAGRQNEPSFQALTKILKAYPQISTEWLISGRGEMIKGQQPEGASLTSGEATVVESETLLKLAVAEAKLEEKDRQLADKDRLIDKLWQLNGLPEKLGKLMSSSDAALARLFARLARHGRQHELVLG